MLRSRSRGTTPHIGPSTGQSQLAGYPYAISEEGSSMTRASRPQDLPHKQHAARMPSTQHSKAPLGIDNCIHPNTLRVPRLWASCFKQPSNSNLRRTLGLFLVLITILFGPPRLATLLSLLSDTAVIAGPNRSPIPDLGRPVHLFDWKNLTSENVTTDSRATGTLLTVDNPLNSKGVPPDTPPERPCPSRDGSPSWRYPTVSRAMLDKLDLATRPYLNPYPQERSEGHVSLAKTDEYTLRHLSSNPPAGGREESRRGGMLPRVLGIPERRTRTASAPQARSRRAGSSNSASAPLSSSNSPTTDLTAVCPTPTERYILPLRLAEQESKSRLHFVQLFHLAKALNRTLVLPNVGKSRMGACGTLAWGVYYDEAGLGEKGWITMEEFRRRLADTERTLDTAAGKGTRQQIEGMSSQLISVGTIVSTSACHAYSLVEPPEKIVAEGSLHLHSLDLVSVYAYNQSSTNALEDPSLNLPGCFTTRFPELKIERSPAFVTVKQSAMTRPTSRLSDEMINAFQRVSSLTFRPFLPLLSSGDDTQEKIFSTSRSLSGGQPDFEAQVLVVNWDLRYPIFPATASSSLTIEMKYSEELLNLAKKLAPTEPYLAVHWRMETVPLYDKMSHAAMNVGAGIGLGMEDERSILEDCAHALVDVVGRLRKEYGYEHGAPDEDGSNSIASVWFASDYPYPIARTIRSRSSLGQMERPPAVNAKSGTFRSFSIEHERAVDVFRRAFEDGGDLDELVVRDVAGRIHDYEFSGAQEQIDRLTEEEKELLEDPGVLGIMDKLVSMRAAVFVSGSPRCSKKSSFTKQVLDARKDMCRRAERGIGNVVDTFG